MLRNCARVDHIDKKTYLYTYYLLVFTVSFDRRKLRKRHFTNYHEKR